MEVVVLGHKHLPNRSTEVVLSRDGIRFTATIATDIFGTEKAMPMYEFMADRVVSEQRRVREIARPGRQLAD